MGKGSPVSAKVKISVIVCTHNRGHYLPQCFASIAAQRSSEPFEVVVVDNGSTDDTPALLQEWSKTDPRFRSIREDRLGLSRAKNTGVGVARGDFLIFTDDDVIVEPDWIKAYDEFFARQTDRQMIAGGPIIPVAADLRDWPRWLHRQALCDIGSLDYGSGRLLEQWEYLWGANMAIPKRIFSKVGPWKETVGRRGEERGTFEDIEYQDRVRMVGSGTWFCPGAIVHHRVDRGTVTPRMVASKAFARGRNEFLQNSLRSKPSNSVSKPQLIVSLAALSGHVTLWIFWTVAFRVSAIGRLFEWSRRAAASSGWWFATLQTWGELTGLRRVLSRIVFAARSFVLRLTPHAS